VLTIIVPGDEYFDDENQEFITRGDIALELEHSLVALSKWEAIHEKPFLGKDEKSSEEVMDYIYAMILTPGVGPGILERLSQKNLEDINAYIDGKKTATWFNDADKSTKQTETLTSELIYYWMIGFNIPFEAQDWHLNRLFTLIRICDVKNSKPKKMSQQEIAARNRELNAKRKAQLGTSG
jgi:hypothetical protein